MSSRRDPDRLRPRRPRIVQDDYSDSEPSDYYDQKPSRSAKPRLQPEDHSRQDPPLAPNDRDDRAPVHTRPRSKVRLREPSVSSDSETAARRHDRGPRRARTDLERKVSPEHDMFRSRRDGYLSDEGEALKQSRRAPRARRDRDTSDSDARDSHRHRERVDPALLAAGGAGAAAGASLPLRRNPRAKSMEAPPYPDDGYEVAPRRQRRPEYDTDPDGPSRRRTTREPRREPRPRYDDYYDEPSPPPRRREAHRSARPTYDERERGYRSDHGSGRRRGDDGGYGYAERDAYERRPRGGGGDGYRSDHGPARRDYYDDPRAGGSSSSRRDRYADPRRDPYDDRRDRARSSGRGGGKAKKGMLGGFKLDENWQKGATDAFLMYGLPLLKKEGPKWAKQAQEYWVKHGAR